MKEFFSENFFNISCYQHKALFEGLEYVWNALKEIERYLFSLKLGLIETEIPEGAFLVNPNLISIGKGSTIEPGSYIKGPCVIGTDCTIRHGAYIRGNLIAGNNCVIGHDTEIKNVIMLNHVHAAHFAYVGDTILGNRVNLGAGTKCANLKFDKKTIFIHFNGKKIDTGLKKFGAILSDDVQTGCNVVTNPGTILGKGVNCCPTLNVKGVVPAYSNVKSHPNQIIELQKNRVL